MGKTRDGALLNDSGTARLRAIGRHVQIDLEGSIEVEVGYAREHLVPTSPHP